MNYTIVIPARYASTRFPGKPLAMLGDRTILQHVYERARLSQAETVIIATDDERIAENARGFDAEVCMTSDRHSSGTERLAEVMDLYAYSSDRVVVNLQGDEPFIAVETIDQVAGLLLQSHGYGMATLCHVIDIPWDRDQLKCIPVYRHIGLYAYTAGFLREYVEWPPCELEKAEALEQLRVLYHGRKIKLGITDEETAIGIDTPADLKKAQQLLASQSD
jgi:3-deoxy-manno-octulosonate cytidylyltransferase (CMP-KDO synthetase)